MWRHYQLDDEAAAAVLEVEARFATRRQPLYAARADALAKVPGFWGSVFASDKVLAPLMTPRDAAALSHVTRFDVVEAPDGGLDLELHFDALNPWVEERALRKALRTDAAGVTHVTSNGLTWRLDTPQGREAAASAQSGGHSFLGWLSQAETIPVGQRDEIAEHLLRDVFANPLQVRAGGMCCAVRRGLAKLTVDVPQLLLPPPAVPSTPQVGVSP